MASPPRESLRVIDTAHAEPAERGRSDVRRSEAALRAVLERLPDAVVGFRPDGIIEFVNAQAVELFGYGREELVGQPVELLWPERLRDRYANNVRSFLERSEQLRFTREVRGLRKDGSEFEGEMSWGVVETEAGVLLLAVGRDLTEWLASEKRLRRRSAEHAVVASLGARALAGADPAELASQVADAIARTMDVELAGVLEWRADADELRPMAVCARAGEPARLLAADTGGHARAALQSPDAVGLEACGAALTGALRSAGIQSGLAVAIRSGDDVFGALTAYALRDGAFDAEDGTFLQGISNVLATAIARRRTDELLRHQALHDPLTGLANRTLCDDRLAQAVARSRRSGAGIAVLFLDLDDFKHINDGHGHAAGDAVLAVFGRRLAEAMRPADTVGRLGGDEFVVICENVSADEARALAHRLADVARRPVPAAGVEHRFSTSIGIAHSDGDPPEPDVLVRSADAAAYRAKRGGPGRVEFALLSRSTVNASSDD
jgi:diguanylate cyclase (GGDEF)-like protein/PAS domain S-box-containing protein